MNAGFGTLLDWAQNDGRFATTAIDPLTFGVGILGVLTVTVQIYRAQLTRWASSCQA